MKKIMILGASILQVPAIKKAKEMGLEVIVLDRDKIAVGFKYADIALPISTTDTPEVLKAAEKYQIDAIITIASDRPMTTVAEVCEKMGLIGISKDTAIKATNKFEMRKALKKADIAVPEFYEASCYEDFMSFAKALNFKGKKCIVKPVDNSGSRGVDLISDFSEEALNKAYTYSKENSYSNKVMVEEYMEGPEVSVETISEGGKCHVIQITDKLTSGPPYFVELGHNQPSMLAKEDQDKIKDLAARANKAIGIEDGPSHTEIKLTEDGPKIVEIGARLGGGNITGSLVPLSTGIDMVEAIIKIAFGERASLDQKFQKASAIRYVTPDFGIIDNISGLDEARMVSGIQEVIVTKKVGDTYKTLHSSDDRLGYVISQADTPERAIEICEEAKNLINVQVK